MQKKGLLVSERLSENIIYKFVLPCDYLMVQSNATWDMRFTHNGKIIEERDMLPPINSEEASMVVNTQK